ncbi:MAG: sigma-E factor negative regulatory protein [Gammaproteobacteria bacterium]|nr:sigma-E factor negative regulatory protein [Gammaproteobacteria bacterium]
MAQALNETLSACFDGEAQRDELRRVLDESNSSEDLRSDWRCYSSISAVLRGEKLSSLESPRNWDELTERIPDDHNIVALQGKRRVNRRTMVGGATAILAMAATLVIGVYVLNPLDDTPSSQSLAVSDDQILNESASSELQVSTSSGTLVNLPLDIQQQHLEKLVVHDANAFVSGSTPITIPQVVTRKVSSSE